MTAVLPPGVSESSLARAIEAFASALGPDAVLTSAEDLAEHRDPYGLDGGAPHPASAVVLPTSTDEVQAVVRIANEHRVPLWTFSQGRNNAYGGPAPRVAGSVLVNLRRMNRVQEVNDELAFAVVEPGVSFFDLYDHLRAGGHRLWLSIPDLGWGSVLGNAVDHGRGYTPYGDHAAVECGMEVVLASGEVLRTGMGAMTGSRSWHVYRRGFGPSTADLFKQSNFGIVTRMGVWLMPEPECYLSGWVRAEGGDERLAALVEALRPLMLHGTIRNYPIISSSGLGIGNWEGWGDWRPGQPPPAELLARAASLSEPTPWAMRFALYGPEPVVDAQLRIVEAAFGSIPGAEVGGRKYAGDRVTEARVPDDKVQGGVPNMDLLDFFRMLMGESFGHLDFSPVGPLTGPDVVALTRLLRSLVERHGLRYGAGIIATPRSVVHICPINFDTADREQTRAAYAAYEALVPEVARAGYGLYRAHLRFMDLVAEQYDFNDHAQRRFNQALKDALDPNGILSPGKQGIWPSSMRPA
jgi:4-cresol dehydrogenase (hydroxylating) flavoprotein subunit